MVRDIQIEGNKRTKRHIILRELNFKEGDSLYVADLNHYFKLNRERIFNTGLFVDVQIHIKEVLRKDTLNTAVVGIEVKEEWYWFPNPIFELSDRNFNEWWYTYDHDFRRVNFGMRYTQKNVRGRNETLKLVAQAGFTRKYELFYTFPYINRKQNLGVKTMFSYSTNRNVAYAVEDNQFQFVRDSNGIGRSRLYTGAELIWRPKYYSNHTFTVRFHRNTVSDAILDKIGAEVGQEHIQYFLDGDKLQRYVHLQYILRHDRRDIQAYPLKGYYLQAGVGQQGIGIYGNVNTFSTAGRIAQYIPLKGLAPKSKLAQRLFFAWTAVGKTSWPQQQPFNLYQGLGFGQTFVRGYEIYVVNGQHFGLFKSTLRYQLFNKEFELLYSPVEAYKTVPVALYPTLYFDAGYVHDREFDTLWNNTMRNRPLFGGGLGLDLVLYRDQVFRGEYSINHLGELTFKLHFTAAI